jgi:hypothetical protein
MCTLYSPPFNPYRQACQRTTLQRRYFYLIAGKNRSEGAKATGMSESRKPALVSSHGQSASPSIPGWHVILVLPLCIGMAMGCYCLTRLKFIEAIVAALAGVVFIALPIYGFLLPALAASYRRLACSIAIFVLNFALLIPLCQHSMPGMIGAGVGWLCLTIYSFRSQNKRDSNQLLDRAALMLPGPEPAGDS